MGLNADLDDLVAADEVASLLGLKNRRAVSVYRGRYSDFPAPVLQRDSGRCQLWLRQDVLAWRGGRMRNQS